MNIKFKNLEGTPHTYFQIIINGVNAGVCCAQKRYILTGEHTNFAALLEAEDELISAGLHMSALKDFTFRREAGCPPKYWWTAERIAETSNDRDGGDYTMWREFHPFDGGYHVIYGTSSSLPFNKATGCFDESEDWSIEDLQVVDTLAEGAQPCW